jgi:hypothetical protein
MQCHVDRPPRLLGCLGALFCFEDLTRWTTGSRASFAAASAALRNRWISGWRGSSAASFEKFAGGFYGDHPINQNLGLTQWFDSRRFSLLFHQDFFLASHGTRVTHLVGRRSNVVRSFGRSGRMS